MELARRPYPPTRTASLWKYGYGRADQFVSATIAAWYEPVSLGPNLSGSHTLRPRRVCRR
jgi:hypothetical protein